MLNEELLSVWLRLSGIIDNQRLADSAGHTGSAADAAPLSFNEALVCGLLAQSRQAPGGPEDGGTPCRTASQLCAETRILKSQMNAILCGLEREGAIERRRSRQDRRQVELRLLPAGEARYEASHRRAISLVNRLIDEMGEESARALLPLLRQAADIFCNMQQEV